MAISLPIVSKFDDKGINQAESGINRLSGFAQGAGVAIAAGLAVAGAAAVAFGAASLQAAADSEAISKQLENAAKNSGAFDGLTGGVKAATDALDKHSTKLAELTGIDDETINKLKARWMTVPGIVALGTDGINNLATISADVAAATGKDIESIGLMFTKVSGDSETALSKLTRAGVILTDEQKNVYQSLLDSNDEAGAQAYLIDQLAQKYKGSAEAMANPFDRLNVIFENLKETIGKAMLPAIEAIIPKIQDFIGKLTASPEFETFMTTLADSFFTLLEALMPLLQPITDLMLTLLPPLMDIVKLLAPEFGNLVEKLIPLLDPILQLVETLLPPLVELFGAVVGLLVDNPDFMANAIKGFEDMNKVAEVLAGFLKSIADFLELIGGRKTNLDSVEARARMTQTAVNPFSLAQSSWQASGGTLNVGKKFATGGIVTKPTRGLVGESGPEAIIPLDQLPAMTGGGSGATVNITVNAGMGADGAALGEQVVNAIRRYERTSGAVFARA